ncbi:hypothetical protein ACCO45_005764 [Purpureocillium lilacinum]|uniref:Uncharacterized protein n=1 Tax=Purpureocillium lilacinum TaxID=33203 RepID=A0ACC4DXK5_PURLI
MKVSLAALIFGLHAIPSPAQRHFRRANSAHDQPVVAKRPEAWAVPIGNTSIFQGVCCDDTCPVELPFCDGAWNKHRDIEWKLMALRCPPEQPCGQHGNWCSFSVKDQTVVCDSEQYLVK